jgi:hypothetical protein
LRNTVGGKPHGLHRGSTGAAANTFVDSAARCGNWEGGGLHDTPVLFMHLVVRKLDDILSRNIVNAFDKANAAELFLVLVKLQ